jgi:DNA-binding XRE family transcriptional regulator
MVETNGDVVTMTREEYESLIDARDHAIAMREIEAGAVPTVPDSAVDDYLAAPTPLAFWRRHHGLTQAELADAAAVTQPYIARLESGQKTSAGIRIYARMAKRLQVRIEDLVVDD